MSETGLTDSASVTQTDGRQTDGDQNDTRVQTEQNESSRNESSQNESSRNESSDEAVSSLDLNEVFHILQNERRRNVLRYLEDADGEDVVEMRDIAVQIAAWENDTTVQQLHSDQRQRVYIALYQSHLPKLDELGVIRYNKPRGFVEPTPLLDEVLGYLNQPDPEPESQPAYDEQESRNWYLPFLGATGISSGFVTAGWLGLLSTSLLSGLGIATGILALYAVVTVSQMYKTGLI